MSFADKDFTQELGKDFYHEDLISREGWAKYYFKGKYERDFAYIQLRIVNSGREDCKERNYHRVAAETEERRDDCLSAWKNDVQTDENFGCAFKHEKRIS